MPKSLKQNIIKMARAECKKSNIDLYLGSGRSVQYSKKLRSNGYFDSENNKLAVAIGRPNWELILLHELNHLRQWQQHCPEWKKYLTIGHSIDDALAGETITESKLHHDINCILQLERDCEIRAVQDLIKLNYPAKKIQQYIQKANAYCMFYLFINENRKWYRIGKEPYNLKSVWKLFPDTFDFDLDLEYQKIKHIYHNCI